MKNTMKKLLALLLALVLTLALAACGQKEENKTDDQTNDPAITDQDNAADEKVTLPVADGAVVGQGRGLHRGGAGCGRQDRHLHRQHR